MNYPLTVLFKFIALQPQMTITDSAGILIFYVKQEMFKLKGETKVYSDVKRTQLQYTIKLKVEKLINFSPRYDLLDNSGRLLGSVKRLGKVSLWKTSYEIFGEVEESPVHTITEENPRVKLADGCLGMIPLLGPFISGFFFHPAYIVARSDGAPVMRLQKQPGFFQRKFRIEKLAQLNRDEETRIILSLMMMNLHERDRG